MFKKLRNSLAIWSKFKGMLEIIKDGAEKGDLRYGKRTETHIINGQAESSVEISLTASGGAMKSAKSERFAWEPAKTLIGIFGQMIAFFKEKDRKLEKLQFGQKIETHITNGWPITALTMFIGTNWTTPLQVTLEDPAEGEEFAAFLEEVAAFSRKMSVRLKEEREKYPLPINPPA